MSAIGGKAPNLSAAGKCQEERNECSILDFTGQVIDSIDVIPNADPAIVILDRNSISKIENLEYYQHLEQLSIADNQLTSMVGVSHLTSLTILNLPGNKIHSIEGLKNLTRLQWLNLSKNSIKAIDNVQGLTSLQHLDLSDNIIGQLGDLSTNTRLQTLLLHGNTISSLRTAPSHLPVSLTILSLAENNIADLNEVSHLAHLVNLEQLSLMNNPCVLHTPVAVPFDYRPFVINWCMNLRILDGSLVTEKEGLKAEWLFSQGRGHHFQPGQHLQLIQYLANVCPLAATTQPEDAKLARVLQQQKVYQQKLLQENTPPPQRGRRSPLHQDSTPPQGVHQQDHQENTPPQSRVGAGRPGPLPTGSPSRESPRMGGRRGSRDGQDHDVSSYSYDVGPASVYGGLYRGSAYKAWSGPNSPSDVYGRPNTAPSCVERPTHLSYQSPYFSSRRQLHNMQAVDDSDETSSVLEAETRFLPLHSELAVSPLKPFNLEYLMTQRSKANDAADGWPTEPHSQWAESRTGSCGPADPCKDSAIPSADLKEDKFSNKPAVSVTRRLAANFGHVPGPGFGHGLVSPQTHHSQPKVIQGQDHHSSSPQPKIVVTSASVSSTPSSVSGLDHVVASSPGSHGNFESHDDTSEYDGLSTDNSQASLELKLLKALMDKRNSEKRHRKSGAYALGRGVQRGAEPTGGASGRKQRPQTDKNQYTPEKYRSGGRRSRATDVKQVDEPSRLSGKDERLNADDKERNLAAIKIQAAWRGYLVRHKDTRVVYALRELRARRSEQHIKYLESEVERQRHLYEREKQLRSLHIEAMIFLWKEVQELQRWKNSVLSSQEQRPQVSVSSNYPLDSQITMESIPRIIETLELGSDQSGLIHNINFPKPSTSSPNPTKVLPPGVHVLDVASSQVRASQKEIELENVCKSLQKQVSQLHEMLTSMSQVMPQGASHQSELNDMHHSDGLLLGGSQTITLQTDEMLPADASVVIKSSQDNLCVSLAPKQQQARRPTAPSQLTAHRHSPTSVQLEWQPSTHTKGSLLGYRIFVNDEAKGMTAANQTTVMLEELSTTCTYRIYVCAVSALGDSPKSNVIVLGPGQVQPKSTGSEHHGADDDDDDPGNESHANQDHSNDKTKEGDNAHSTGGSETMPPDHNTSQDPSHQGSQHVTSSNNVNTTSKSYADRHHGHEQSPDCMPATTHDLFTPKGATKHLRSHEQSPYDDSGYLTSPNGVQQLPINKLTKVSLVTNDTQDNSSQCAVKSDIVNTGKDMASGSIAVTTAVLDSHEDMKVSMGASPRISEGLTKKLEGSREIKQAVKSQKRKPSPDHGMPLKAIPSEPDNKDKDMKLTAMEDCDDSKTKVTSKIPVYTGRSGLDDNKPQRKSSWADSSSSSEGSKSRKSSLTDSRSRKSSGSDGSRVRKLSTSEQEPEGSMSPNKGLTAHIKNQENLKQLLNEAAAKIRATQEKNPVLAAVIKVKSNTFGAESSTSALVTNTDQTPQSQTWPKEKGVRHPINGDDIQSAIKAPDVTGVRRKNSLTRKTSVRNHHRSGSDSSDGSDQSKKESHSKTRRHHNSGNSSSSRKSSASEQESTSLLDHSSASEQASGMAQNFVRDSRGRMSHREPKRPKESASEKRASSVGPVIHDTQTLTGVGVITDKPPLARPPHTRLPDTAVILVSSRQRSKSEQGTSCSGEATDISHTSNCEQQEKNKASPRDKQTSPPVKISHRRCASDAAIVPSLNLSESDSVRERTVTPPSIPKQCPSSPRARRSSSFSKSHSGATATDEGVALLRQCISLETLKAAKSADAKEKLLARHKQKQTVAKNKESSGEEQMDSAVQEYTAAGSASDSTASRSKFHRSHSLREMRSKKTEQRNMVDSNQMTGMEIFPDQQSAKPDRYSPKLNCAKKETSSKHGKIKLGSKAADLFAKLQMKVSNSKS